MRVLHFLFEYEDLDWTHLDTTFFGLFFSRYHENIYQEELCQSVSNTDLSIPEKNKKNNKNTEISFADGGRFSDQFPLIRNCTHNLAPLALKLVFPK